MANQKNIGHWSETAARDGAELLRDRKKIPSLECGEEGKGLDYKTGIDLLLDLYNGLSLTVQVKSSDKRKERFRKLTKFIRKYEARRYILFFSDVKIDELKRWERQSIYRDLLGRNVPEGIHIEHVYVGEVRQLFELPHDQLLGDPRYREFLEDVACALLKLIDIACANALRYEQRQEEVRREKERADLPREERK